MLCYSYMGHRMSLKFHWSPSRELFGIIHPEEPLFNILSYLTMNFDDCKSIISVLNFPYLVFLFYCSKSLVALQHCIMLQRINRNIEMSSHTHCTFSHQAPHNGQHISAYMCHLQTHIYLNNIYLNFCIVNFAWQIHWLSLITHFCIGLENGHM
jgi:hypothetical protein